MDPFDLSTQVPVSDLEVLRAALNSAYHHSTTLDLAEQYRKLSLRPLPSQLTQALQNALTLVITYIDIAAAEAAQEAGDGA